MWGAIIGAIIAAMGSYMQYNAQKKAANKVANENLRAMQARNQREKDTVDAVKNRSRDYSAANQEAEQADIQQKLEQDYYQPAMEAQAINQAASTTQGDVSSDYTAAKEAANADVLQKNADFANILSRINAAKDWRMNEGFRIGDLATDVGLMGNFQRGDDAVSQMKMQAAANSGAGQALLGQLMQIGGTTAMSYGLGNLGSGGDTGSNLAGDYSGKGLGKLMTTGNSAPSGLIGDFSGKGLGSKLNSGNTLGLWKP